MIVLIAPPRVRSEDTLVHYRLPRRFIHNSMGGLESTRAMRPRARLRAPVVADSQKPRGVELWIIETR